MFCLRAQTWAGTIAKRLISLTLIVMVALLLMPAGNADAATPRPMGRVDSTAMSVATDTLQLTGWSMDPSVRGRSNFVLVTVDGRGYGTWRSAAVGRPDVNKAFGATGGHGFQISVMLPVGTHTVCVTSRPAQTATPTSSLGCWSYTVYPKVTKAQMLAVAKTIDPTGTISWVWTPSTAFSGQAEPWNNRILISSTGVTTRYLRATMLHEWAHVLQYRAFGGGQGWWDAVGSFNALLGHPGDEDSYTGLEQGADCTALAIGSDHLAYGCPAALRVFGARIAHGTSMSRPQGVTDSVTVNGRSLTVKGWSVDPANPTRSSAVQVTDNGVARTGSVATSLTRVDVNAAMGVSGRHGFQLVVTVQAGTHLICVTSRSSTTLAITTLTHCVTVTVR